MIVMSSYNDRVSGSIIKVSNNVMGCSFRARPMHTPLEGKGLQVGPFFAHRTQLNFLKLFFNVRRSHTFARRAGTTTLHGIGSQNPNMLLYFSFIDLRTGAESQIKKAQ